MFWIIRKACLNQEISAGVGESYQKPKLQGNLRQTLSLHGLPMQVYAWMEFQPKIKSGDTTSNKRTHNKTKVPTQQRRVLK